MRVGGANFRRSDVAAGVEPDRGHGRKAPVGAGQEDEPVRDDWRGHRNVAAAVQAPELLAGREVVAAGVMPAVHQDLRASAASVESRRAPGWDVLARDAPDLPA